MSVFETEAVVAAVRKALNGRATAAFHAPPVLTIDDTERLVELIRREPVGCTHVRDLEYLIARRVGRAHAIAVSSGTAALHLALMAVGVKYGSMVIVPALTFSAAVAAVRYCQASPVFQDGEQLTTVGAPAAAAIGVDLLGMPMTERARRAYHLMPYIEDAAQALGSSVGGKQSGSFGDVSILSFNNNKIVTAGGGGMVLTDRDDIAERVRFLATTAKTPSPHFYEHAEVGFNYRMPNACAALGLIMLSKLDAVLEAKRKLHLAYVEAFAGIEGVTIVEAPPGTSWNHWLNAIEVPPESRDGTLQALTAAGYECRALFTPLPWLAPYKPYANDKEFPEAARRFATTICLPSGPELAS